MFRLYMLFRLYRAGYVCLDYTCCSGYTELDMCGLSYSELDMCGPGYTELNMCGLGYTVLDM